MWTWLCFTLKEIVNSQFLALCPGIRNAMWTWLRFHSNVITWWFSFDVWSEEELDKVDLCYHQAQWQQPQNNSQGAFVTSPRKHAWPERWRVSVNVSFSWFSHQSSHQRRLSLLTLPWPPGRGRSSEPSCLVAPGPDYTAGSYTHPWPISGMGE